MSASEETIIPLDDAHEILSVFGIGPYSRGYQRWRRGDGFRLADLVDVLDESGLILGVDWRAWLKETTDEIIDQLAKLEISTTVELDESGNLGTFFACGESASIKYVPVDEDDFDEVIAAINRLIGSTAQYKKLRSCEGTDGWTYAILANADWQSLIDSIPDSLGLVFVDV